MMMEKGCGHMLIKVPPPANFELLHTMHVHTYIHTSTEWYGSKDDDHWTIVLSKDAENNTLPSDLQHQQKQPTASYL
jgi:hypothetical protein